MSTETKQAPSAGAMRAAKLIEAYWRDNFHETPSEEDMAELIDRETGVRKLLEALERLKKAVVGSIWVPLGTTGDESDWWRCELCNYTCRTVSKLTHNPTCPMSLAEAALRKARGD